MNAPVNDKFANATNETATTGWQVGNNIGATAEPSEPANFGFTVWWKWTCTATDNYFFTTGGNKNFFGYAGTYTNFPSIVQIFTANNPSSPSVGALTEVTYLKDERHGIGDGFEYGAEAAFAATAGTTYWIRVDSRDGVSVGNIFLGWGSWSTTTLGPCTNCTSAIGAICSAASISVPPFNINWSSVYRQTIGGSNSWNSVINTIQMPPGEIGFTYCSGAIGRQQTDLNLPLVWEIFAGAAAFLHSGAAERYVGVFWTGISGTSNPAFPPSVYTKTSYQTGQIVFSINDSTFYQCIAGVTYLQSDDQQGIGSPGDDPTHWSTSLDGGIYVLSSGGVESYPSPAGVKTAHQCLSGQFCHAGGAVGLVMANVSTLYFSNFPVYIGPFGGNGYVDGNPNATFNLYAIKSSNSLDVELTSFTVTGYANGVNGLGGYNVTATVQLQNYLTIFATAGCTIELLAEKNVQSPKVYNGTSYVTGPLTLGSLGPLGTQSVSFEFVAKGNQSGDMVLNIIDGCHASTFLSVSFPFDLAPVLAFSLVAEPSSTCSGVTVPFSAFEVKSLTNSGTIATTNLKIDIACVKTTGAVPLVGLCKAPVTNPSVTALSYALTDISVGGSLSNFSILCTNLDGKTQVTYQVQLHDDFNVFPPQQITLTL